MQSPPPVASQPWQPVARATQRFNRARLWIPVFIEMKCRSAIDRNIEPETLNFEPEAQPPPSHSPNIT